MAFHPDFATNGLVYLNFSELVGGVVRSVTAEFASADGGQTLAPASERVLLTVTKPATNHNGGNLEFGPDGFLYVGLGDGGGSGDPQGNAQNPQRLLGKMLRIDVDTRPGGAPYGIPRRQPVRGEPALQRRRHRPAELPGDLCDRLPQSLALELRPAERRSLGRRRGPGKLGRDRPRRGRRQLRLGHPRGRALLRARERLPDRGPHRPGRRVRPRRRLLDHRRLRVPRRPGDRRSRAATCSATSAA